MSNLNDIINQVNHLTGYRLDPITLNVSSSAPSGTINTLGIYPGSVIKSEQVLNIINALNGTTTDFIIVSGSFALPSITGSQSLAVSGGIVYGTQTVGSASYAVSASLPLEGIISASVASTTITFYKGDSTSFSINVAQSGSIESSSYAVFAQNAATASIAVTSSYALTASFVATASSAITSSYAISSSLAQTASFVTLAQTASFINLAKSASFALTASYLNGSISSSISSSYAAYAQTYAPVFPYTGSAIVSGSLRVIGQTQLSSSLGVTGSVGFSYVKSTPNVGVWSVGNPLNSPRYNLAGAGTQNAAVAFGGNFSGSSVGITETYDGFSSVWSTSEAMVYGRELMAGFGTAGAAVAAGGFISYQVSGSNLSYTETYDGNTWTVGNNLNTGRQALAGAGTQNAGVVFGGYNGVNPQSATEKYNGSVWSAVGNLITPRGYLAGVGTQNNALAIGGTNGTILANTEKYNGTTWSTAGNLNVARYSLAAAGTVNAALAFGGISGSALATTEEYNGTSWVAANPLNNANSNLAGAGSQTAGIAFGGINAVGYTEFYNPETVGILTKTFDYSAETGQISATGSLFGTSSHASYAISASYALTASYWQGVSGPKSITGSLTISGSQTFENIGPAKFSGSTSMTGSLDVVGPATIPNLTGSIFGSASYALTASYALNVPTQSLSASYAISSSYSTTSSLPLQGIITASVAASTITFRKGDNTTFNITVSQSGSVQSSSYANYAENAGTASIAISSSYALTASYALNVPTQSVSASYAATASYVLQAVSASYAMTSSRSITASVAILADFATSAGNTPSASRATSAATADNATSSSYALSASYALSSSYATLATNANTASYVLTAQTASYVLNAISSSRAISAETSSLPLLGVVTASALASTITFTRGDQTTFDVTIAQSGSVQSSSYAGFAENAATASLPLLGIVTASANASTITFTRGDQTTFDVSISQSGSVQSASYATFAENAGTASIATSSSYALTASYALNVPTQSVSSSYAATASVAISSSYASTASIANIQYVTNSGNLALGQIQVLDYSDSVATTYVNGLLTFVFGTPALPSALVASIAGFATDRFNQVTDNYTVNTSWSNGGYTLISASLYEGSIFLTGITDSGTSLSYNTTTSGSHTYRLAYTASSPLDNSIYLASTTTTGTLSKTNPGAPTISATPTLQLGAASNQVEQGATGSIAFTSASGASNGWISLYTTSSVASPYAVVGSLTGSASIPITATSFYSSSGVSGSDNNPALTTTSTSTTTYTKIRSLRSGATLTSSYTQNQLENLSNWDTTLGGTVGTIQKGTTTVTGQSVTINWTGSLYQYIAYDSARANLTAINSSGFNVSASFTLTTVGNYKVYRTTDLQAGYGGTTVTYTLI